MSDASKSEEIQAVLVTESFSSELSLLETPVSLIPIVNVAAIDWTLEFLSRTPVKEVIVVSSIENAKSFEDHISKNWLGESQPFRLKFVSANILSVGDALREVDRRGNLIQSEEFLLLHAGVVCNSDLKKPLSEHRLRRQKDKSCVMTLLHRTSDPDHPGRSRTADCLIGYETKSSRILSYQRLKPNDNTPPHVDLGLLESGDMDWRLDLLDCCMAICSKQIPPLFQDNFDYQKRDDLINEILENEELLGQKIHLALLDSYQGFSWDLNSYMSLNWDILNRWSYPLSLDRNVPSQTLSNLYSYCPKNIYVHHDGVKLGRNSLSHTVAVGRGTTIEQDSVASRSVIGHNCKIGHNVHISNSILWDNVVVGDNCRIEGSVVCTGAIVGANCIVAERCIVGPQHKIADGTKIAAGTVDSTASSRRKESGGDVKLDWVEWKPLEFSKETEEENIAGDDQSQGDGESSDGESDDNQTFYGEILESIQKGVEDKVDVDTIRLEINSSKHAYNVGFDELCQLLTKAVLSVRLTDVKTDAPLPHLQKVVKHVLPILKSYLKTPSSQFASLKVVEDLSSRSSLADCLNELLFMFYNGDLMQEESILKWAEELSVRNKMLAKKVEKFVTWLKEAEEDSDE